MSTPPTTSHAAQPVSTESDSQQERRGKWRRPSRRRTWLIRTAVALVALWVLATAGIGTFVFHSAIQRAAPLGTIAAEGADGMALTMANARKEGWKWITATPHERWTQQQGDDVETVGYWFPAVKKTTRTVVLLHGHRADASLMGELGASYRARGFNVFMADARGHGMSGGDYAGMGHLDQNDYIGWLKRLVNTVGNEAQILLHGISMGGSTALMLSAHPQLPSQVKAVIDDCGYTSVNDEFTYQVREVANVPAFIPAVAVASLETRLSAGYWFADADALTAAGKTRLPVFVIHGDADTYNPTWMSKKIYNAVKSPKQLWLVPGAEHGESFFTHRTEYEQRTTDFYNRHLTTPTS
ncbi:alpha/beta hydrolase [Streptomyces lushanensis]|uniref:alpha/beta hydrolase n=1 Tax=Streptomyces lushanensis TaxID=1434255 RepID=UPI00082A753E|nr:alpha/beta hydrolase [Streptomyces lushanensis]